jgi:hypothetical protein
MSMEKHYRDAEAVFVAEVLEVKTLVESHYVSEIDLMMYLPQFILFIRAIGPVFKGGNPGPISVRGYGGCSRFIIPKVGQEAVFFIFERDGIKNFEAIDRFPIGQTVDEGISTDVYEILVRTKSKPHLSGMDGQEERGTLP